MIFYTILYNASLADNGWLKSLQLPSANDPQILRIKMAVDNGIMKYLGMKNGLESQDIPYINATWSSYPEPADRMAKGFNMVVMFGTFFLIMPSMFLFTIILTDLSREKELKLR